MKKLSAPLSHSEWQALDVIPLHGSKGNREAALREAMHEFARFVGWDDATLRKMKAGTGLMQGVENTCAELRRNLTEDERLSGPASQTLNKIRRIVTNLNEVQSLMEDWGVQMKICSCFESRYKTTLDFDDHEEFRTAATSLEKLTESAVEASKTKKRVVRTVYGQTSSNMPKLVFLQQCQLMLTSFTARRISLYKGNPPLVRFARPLFKYATGLEGGSFDRQLQELRYIPPNTADKPPAPRINKKRTAARLA